MRFCFRGVAGLMVIAWALPVVVGQPPGAGGPGQPTVSEPAKPKLTVKVFKLERGNPEAVVESLNALLESPDAEVVLPLVPRNPPGGGTPGGLGGMGLLPPGGLPGGFGGAPGFGGVPAPASGQSGFGSAAPSGAIGCFFGSGGTSAPPVWRATVQMRTRAVVVRGSERHLKVAADLVALLDRPAAAPLPKLQVVKAFALKHATAEELSEVITALSFEDTKLATPGARLLTLVAPDDVVKSVTELVQELDVPGKDDTERKSVPAKELKPSESKSPR